MELPKGMIPPAPPAMEAPTTESAPRFLPVVARLLDALEGAVADRGLTVHVERMEADTAGGSVRVALVMRVGEVNDHAGPVPEPDGQLSATGE